MKIVSDEIKNMIAMGNVPPAIYDFRIKNLTTNKVLEIPRDNIKPPFNENLSVGGDIYGAVPIGTLSVDINGNYSESIDINVPCSIEFDTILRIDDNTEYTIKNKTYYITSVKYDKRTNITKIDAMDKMNDLNVEFKQKELTYPCKFSDWVVAFFSQIGLQLENTSFFNNDFIIQREISFNTPTSMLAIAKQISKFTMSIITLTNDNKVKFIRLSTLGKVHNGIMESNIREFEEVNNNFKSLGINTLVLGLQSDIDGENVARKDDAMVNTDGVVELRLDNIEFVWNQELKETVIDKMFNEIKGFKYNAHKSKTGIANLFFYELGDTIKQKVLQPSYNVPVLSIRNTYHGSIQTDLEADCNSVKQAETEYANFSPRKITEIRLDKTEQNIKIIIDNENEMNQKVTKIEQDLDSVKIEVHESNSNNIVENLNGEEGLTKWTFSQNGLLPSTTLLPSTSLYPRNQTSSIFKVIDSPHSLSETEIYFFAKGTALSDLAKVVQGGRIYSYRVRRMQGTSHFKVRIHEYSSETSRTKITTILESENKKDYETASIELRSDTKFIRLEYVIDNPGFSLSEGMFNRGVPKEYFKSGKEAYNYANAEIKVLSTEIDLRVEKDGVIAAINLSSETAKIKANNIELEGSVTVNEKFKVLTDGTIQAVDGKFSGTITATNIEGGEIKGAKIIATEGDIGGWKLSTSGFYNDAREDFNYVQQDYENIMKALKGEITLTESQKDYYDIDKTGVVNAADYMQIKNIVDGTEPNYLKSRVKMNSELPREMITFEITEGFRKGLKTSIGAFGINGNAGEFTSLKATNFQTPTVNTNSISSFNVLGSNPSARPDLNVSAAGDLKLSGKAITASSQIVVSSDRRAKENIEDIDLTDAIDLINIKSFNYIGNEKETIGIIAQDLLDTSIEKFVVSEHNDRYAVDYNAVSLVGLYETKVLRKQVKNLTERVKLLEGEQNGTRHNETL